MPVSHSFALSGRFSGVWACERLKLSSAGRIARIRSIFANNAMRLRSSSVRRFIFSMSAIARLPSSVIWASFCSVSFNCNVKSSVS